MLWLLALLGAIRRFRAGYADQAAAALCLAPLLMFGLQVYGGEMLLRIYFFMLPFVAFFAAAALRVNRVPGAGLRARLPVALRGSATVTALGLPITVLLAGCLLARYGNERANYFTPSDRAAFSFLYAQALPGSTFAVEQPYLPWKYQGYDQHKYLSVESMLGQPNSPSPSPAQALALVTRALRPFPGHPAGFVILTRSQHVYAQIFGGVLSLSYLDRFEHLLSESPRFRLVYASSTARVYLRQLYQRHPALSQPRRPELRYAR